MVQKADVTKRPIGFHNRSLAQRRMLFNDEHFLTLLTSRGGWKRFPETLSSPFRENTMSARKNSGAEVELGLERRSIRIPIANLRPLHAITSAIKKSRKYSQIESSIREIGIIEPPVVAKCRDDAKAYLLLDGHVRVDILRQMGETEVTCLISTDDEGFTYNKRVNRLAIIQEHKMILKAIDRGAPEAKIAAALSIWTSTHCAAKFAFPEGICPEALADLLKDRHVASNAFTGIQEK